MSENSNMMYCRECAAKIQRDSKFCRECGASQLTPPAATVTAATSAPAPIQWIESAVAVEKPKTERRLPPQRIMLVAITLAIILGGSFIILATPWIPVVKSYHQLEQYPYSYEVTERREIPNNKTVFSSEPVSLKAWVDFSQTSNYWVSKDFHLEKGWTVSVALVTESKDVVFYVKDGKEWQGDTYCYSDKPYSKFFAPYSGDFHVIIENVDFYSAHTASIELTAEWTNVQLEQRTVNATITFDVTRYNVTYVSPIDLMLRRT